MTVIQDFRSRSSKAVSITGGTAAGNTVIFTPTNAIVIGHIVLEIVGSWVTGGANRYASGRVFITDPVKDNIVIASLIAETDGTDNTITNNTPFNGPMIFGTGPVELVHDVSTLPANAALEVSMVFRAV